MPPTPGHLTKVIQIARNHPGVVILTAAWSNNRAVKKVVLASMARTGQSWLQNMETLHVELAKAFGVPYGENASKQDDTGENRPS